MHAEVATAQHATDVDLRATPLNLPQRELFAQQYIIDFTAAQAAVRAGYAPKNARAQGSRLLTDADMLARVRFLVQRRQALTEVEQARVVAELARIGFSDIGEVMEWGPNGATLVPSDQLPLHARAAIQSVKVKETVLATMKNGDRLLRVETEVKMHPKNAPLSLLAQHTVVTGKGAREGGSPRVTLWSGRNRD